MANYRISKKAISDIDSIWLYTNKKWSSTQADKYYTIIYERIEHIAKYPEIGRVYDYVKKGYRGLQVKSHIIFYKITSSKSIDIIRVLHQQIDIEYWLDEGQ